MAGWFPGGFPRRLLLYERRSTRSRFIGVGGGNCDSKPFYGDFVSLHRHAQLPRLASPSTPSFIKTGNVRCMRWGLRVGLISIA